jgi:hypothetical protein
MSNGRSKRPMESEIDRMGSQGIEAREFLGDWGLVIGVLYIAHISAA